MIARLIILLLFGIFLTIVIYRFLNRNKNPKIIDINHRRMQRSKQQPCSYCKKKSNRLAFFSDPQGLVVGLCESCKDRANQQSWHRL